MTDCEALSASLYKTDATSDKEYHLHLRPQGDAWEVGYQNGKRGRGLTAGLKTKTPVDYAAARKVYDTTLRSKLKDGYTPELSGEVYAGTDQAGAVTGFQPQLLNPTDEEGIVARVLEGGWGFQIKHDGDRRWVQAREKVIYSNRRGLEVGVRTSINTAITTLFQHLPAGFELDGEDMGHQLIVFDILAWDGTDMRAKPFAERAALLDTLDALITQLGLHDGLRISPVFTFADEAHARAQMQALRARKEEGIVAKQLDAPAKAGRPNSNGPAMKCKFWESATVRVAPQSRAKRSVALEVYDTTTNTWVEVGNCTIPTNAAIPQAGDLIEVIYLYAHKGGALCQPIFDKARPDMTEADARMDRLKFINTPA